MTLKTSDELFALNGGRVTTLADFSLAAYDELDGDIAVNRLLSPGGTLTQGWHFLDLSELNLGPPNSGFRYANDNAEAIAAVAHDALVISFRGTDSLVTADGLADVKDWLDFQTHYSKFVNFIDSTQTYIEAHPEITKIYVTGHSLGAAMVHAYMATHRDTNNLKFEAVTFASPGTDATWLDPDPSRTIGFHNADDIIDFGAYRDGAYQLEFKAALALVGLMGLASGTPLITDLASWFSRQKAENTDPPGDDQKIFYGSVDGVPVPYVAQHKMVLYQAVTRLLALEAEYVDWSAYDNVVVGRGAFDANDGSLSLGQGYAALNFGQGYFNSGRDADAVKGGSGRDLLVGGDEADFISGFSGADGLSGGSGDDTLVGGTGNDIIDGGENNDTAIFQLNSSFYEAPERWGNKVIVTTKTGLPAATDDGTDTLYNVEFLKFPDKTVAVFNNPELPDLSAGTVAGGTPSDGAVTPLVGGRSGNDGSTSGSAGATIVGNDTSEYLSGTSRADVIRGNGGDDILTGYGGQDSFDGGSGSDTVDYSYEPASVSGTIDLAAGTAAFPGFYTEQLISIENVWMGAGGDTVYGDAGDNDLRGGPGNDILQGGLGNDHIYGDWKYSDQGGNDTAIMSYTFGAGYTVSGSADALHIVGAEGDDWYYNIENFQFVGGVTKTATQMLAEVAPTYTTIKYPVSLSTAPVGINAAGQIYGTYLTGSPSNQSAHSFYYNNGVYIPIEHPSSNFALFYAPHIGIKTIITDINDAGQLVGQYIDNTGRRNSFSYDSGTYTTIDDPLATGSAYDSGSGQTLKGTFVNGINNAGMVFGGYIDSEGKSKSFISNGETYTTIDDSSGTSTGGRIAINDLGQVIGTYTTPIPFKNGFETHGFLYSNGTYTTIDDPSGTTYSLIAINNARQIIGLYQDSQHNLNSFFYSEGIYLTLAGPSGARTLVASLNDAGEAIGTYNDNTGTMHGFLYRNGAYITIDDPSGTIHGLNSINNAGEIIGTYYGTSGGIHGFVYRDGTYTDIDQAQSASYSTFLNAINDAGEIIGTTTDTSGSHAFLVTGGTSPIAQDDEVTALANTPLGGNTLIDNGEGADSDPDGDALTVVAVNNATTDIGETVTLASGALLVVNPDGRFVYDANGKFDSLNVGETASDGFTYTISNGQGHTATATVNLTIDGIVHGLQITGGSGILNGTTTDDQIAGGPENEIIHGGAGSDWLQGGPGNDTLFGDEGSDILNGDAGLDSIRGGSGADILIFGAAALADAHSATPIIDTVADYDQGNTGAYGASEGDLIDLSSVLSTAHAGGQHVPALVRAITDSGNTFAKLQVDSDGAGSGHTWTDIARLDGLSALADVTVLVDTSVTATITVAAASGIMIVENSDGTHTGYRWDLADQNSWSDSMTTYTSQGSAQTQTTNYDDDTHTIQTWDVLNQNTWANYVWSYDPAWHANSQTVSYDDGTRTEQTWDVLSQNTWSDYVWSYDAQGRTAMQFVNYDDHIHTAQYWDAAESEPWSSWVGYYDLQQRESAHFVNMDDGTRTGQYWDVEGNEAWSTWAGYYDSQNSETTHFVTMDDGSRTAQYFDVSGQYNWSNFVYTYDDQNRLTSQTVIYDDSTRRVQYWDAANTQPWATIVEVYAANGIQTSRTVYNDDRSHVPPVVLDLDGNGIDITPLSGSTAFFDVTGGGERLPTAWVGGHDGLLAIDLGADGQAGADGIIDQAKEINFTLWAPGTTSDLQALRQVFDTDQDGKLDPGDARWNEFRVWTDPNSDGVSQPGEVKTLSDLAITSIDLSPSPSATTYSDGSAIQGLSSFTRSDGSNGLVGDVSLAYGMRVSGPPDLALLGNYMASAFAPSDASSVSSTSNVSHTLNQDMFIAIRFLESKGARGAGVGRLTDPVTSRLNSLASS